jgi:hypothetical protein
MAMPNTKLTRHQEDSMASLRHYVGQTVEVMTSHYDRNVNPEFVKRAVGGVHNSAALRGLEAKGYIKIEDAFWKGARITVLKGMDA